MKKLLSCLLAAALLLGLLTGCGGAAVPEAGAEGTIRIVATVFPVYDWVRHILGDNPAGAELTLLLDGGADLHSFQPTAADILRVSGCDLFLYIGGPSDGWVRDALRDPANPEQTAISLLDALGDLAREETPLEGMQADDDADSPEADEHIWLSLRCAAALVERIGEALAAIDGANAAVYRRNASDYIAALNNLDGRYAAAVAAAAGKTLLFGDRFPFRYLAEDYGLTCYAAFDGCSAETEASFETVTFLAGKVDELGLPAVLIVDGSDGRIAETVVRSTRTQDQKILTLDSLQSAAAKDAETGGGYLDVMERNLAVLTEALG